MSHTRRLLGLSVLVASATFAQTPNPAPASPAPASTTTAAAAEKLDPHRFREFFRPFRTDRAAISPDGKHLAFTVREADKLYVVTCATDKLDTALAKVLVADDESASPMLVSNQAESTPAAIHWMRWVLPNRLVIETNRISVRFDGGWSDWRGAVIAFDADGGNAKTLVQPSDVPELSADAEYDRSFSIDPRDSRFGSLIPTSDQPLPENPDEADTRTAVTDSTQAFDALPPANQPLSPRQLRVFATDPERPGSILLMVSGTPRARGSRSHEFFTIDSGTGKIVSLGSDLVSIRREAMIDRQGHLRLTLPDSLLRKFPHPYEYHGAKGRDRTTLLGRYLDLPEDNVFTVSPENYFGERSIPLGFDRDSRLLYIASNEGRDTFGIYTLNLDTKQRGSFAVENPRFDLIGPPRSGFPGAESLVYDPYDHSLAGIRHEGVLHTATWLVPELQDVQRGLEQRFPGRVVEILDWDQGRQRILLMIEGPADAGAFYVLDRPTNRLTQFARRAPWIDSEHAHATLPFGFATPDGTRLTGLITVPRAPKLKPVPLVVFSPGLPWQRVRSTFQTEVQALADMGFAVAQINARGAWGFGRTHRERITAGYDLAQVEDLVTTVQKLCETFTIDRNRVALVGIEHGGFIALRALQDHPKVFRCAVALNAPIEIDGWLKELFWAADDVQSALTRTWFGDAARLDARPLLRGPVPTKPVLLLPYPGIDGQPRLRTYLDNRGFARRLKSAGTTFELQELTTDYMRGLPKARADAFGLMEAFLNEHIYSFSVKLGELHEVK